jgi:hypothetical protein
MPAQHIGDTLRDEGQGCVVAESQEDDSLMRLTQPKYQLAKVPIVGDQDTSFSLRDGAYGSIWKAGGVICADARDVVALLCQKLLKSGVNILTWLGARHIPRASLTTSSRPAIGSAGTAG